MRRVPTGILISGRGSNMRALIEAAREPSYPAEIVCVASNREDADGLAFARRAGIAAHAIDHRHFTNRERFDAAMRDYLLGQSCEIVACAGYMRIMTPVLVSAFEGRMLNIHPSLLPAYKGLNTHERALADGATRHGCTVHLVTEELDAGPFLMQAEVPVLPQDTPATLAARVLAEEHRIYPLALAALAEKLQAKTSN